MVEAREGEVARFGETRRSTGLLAQCQAEGVNGCRPVVMILILDGYSGHIAHV